MVGGLNGWRVEWLNEVGSVFQCFPVDDLAQML